jgi:transcriptional regulator with XRE-family HTH domain
MPKGPGRRRGSGAYNPIDVHVGNRLRTRRTLLGLSQMALADAIGLTFQQLQKYEKGANRITASRLYDLSQVLGVEIAYFFDDMDQATKTASPAQASARRSAPSGTTPNRSEDPLHKRETLELARAYYRISDPSIRTRLRKLIQSAAQAASSKSS